MARCLDGPVFLRGQEWLPRDRFGYRLYGGAAPYRLSYGVALVSYRLS
jgi:hypothetical protein